LYFTIRQWEYCAHDGLPSPGFIIFAREDFGSYGFRAPSGVFGSEVFYIDDHDESAYGPQQEPVAPSLREFLRRF